MLVTLLCYIYIYTIEDKTISKLIELETLYSISSVQWMDDTDNFFYVYHMSS